MIHGAARRLERCPSCRRPRHWVKGEALVRFTMPTPTTEKLSIWCLQDGKAGHQNQVLGLAEAINRLQPAVIHKIELTGWKRGFRSIFSKSPSGLPIVRPDFIIGAGHASHVPLCVYQRRFGGRSVVLMKPTLPLQCFDICLIPDVHRLRTVPANVVLTKGVLNRVRPGNNKNMFHGLILVGGPSSHYRWSGPEIFDQIQRVVKHSADIKWTIVTSRRTPEEFCIQAGSSNIAATIVKPDAVGSDWLPEQLAAAGTVWVSEDSVSMTYEALTSGSQVGILELNRHRSNRVTDCIDTLVTANFVTRWSNWKQRGSLVRPAERFCEAERCANEILQRTATVNQNDSRQRVA